jgi:hypothetical protein
LRPRGLPPNHEADTNIFLFLFLFFIFCRRYSARSMVMRFAKVFTIKNKTKIKEKQKFTRSFDRILTLANNSDTMKNYHLSQKFKLIRSDKFDHLIIL